MATKYSIRKKIISKDNQQSSTRKIFSYIALFVVLFCVFFILRNSTWRGNAQLHTIMEVIATVLALIVGVLALARFYTQKYNTFLFIGTGFIGTGLLDGYHAFVTSTFFYQSFPSSLHSLVPWSWSASRTFLAILMFLSYWAWRREEKDGTGTFSEQKVYLATAVLTIISFLFFAFVPLPRAYYPEYIIGRPQEFISALFFLLALGGYLHKGKWKEDAFEHWLVLSLIVGFMGQAMFMPFSHSLFDAMFDSAHVLKKLSYICVLSGLLISMYAIFRREVNHSLALENANVSLIYCKRA